MTPGASAGLRDQPQQIRTISMFVVARVPRAQGRRVRKPIGGCSSRRSHGHFICVREFALDLEPYRFPSSRSARGDNGPNWLTEKIDADMDARHVPESGSTDAVDAALRRR